MYLVLPICLLEIMTNVVNVFFPSKPYYLAQIALQKSEISMIETITYTNVMTVPLLLPIGVAFHGYFAGQSLWDKDHKNVRLHMHHMLSAIVWMTGPAIFRFIAKLLFILEYGGCHEHTDNPHDSIEIQVFGILISGIIVVMLKNVIYMSLSPTLKQNINVNRMRLFWLYAVMHTIVAGFCLDLNMIPNCRSNV